MGLEKPGHQSV